MDCYAVHRRVRIDAGPGVRAQADGDVIGETPLEIGILPQALRIVVPAEADADERAGDDPGAAGVRRRCGDGPLGGDAYA